MASTDIYNLMKLITPYNTTTSPEQNPYNPTQEQLGLISWFQVAFCQCYLILHLTGKTSIFVKIYFWTPTNRERGSG